jgi:hypothetical protein
MMLTYKLQNSGTLNSSNLSGITNGYTSTDGVNIS